MAIADIKDIMSVIPHRPPFLLIDRIEELTPGERVVALKNVTMNEPFFVGHFPREPVMPGVLIVEALAQAGAYAVLSLEENKGRIAYFGAINDCKFRGKVVPGDALRLEVTIKKLRPAAGVGDGRAYVDGKLVCQAEITFMLG